MAMIPGITGGSTLASGQVSAPATWRSGDLAVAGVQTSGGHPLGTTGPTQYAYGISYDGPLTGAAGVLITGQEQPDATINLLVGDTLNGSAVLWSDTTGGGVGIAGVEGSSPSANLGGLLTATGYADPTLGASQLSWVITDASVAGVDATPTSPGLLQAGYVDGSGPTGQVSIFVINPTLDASVEVCATGVDCDPTAAAGTGGWTSTPSLPESVGAVTVRINATNTGNIDLSNVTVATTTTDTAGSASLSACLGLSLGDLAVGATASVTCQTPTAGLTSLSASVSGVFTGDGPDGQPLINRFQDTAGVNGRVPSPIATATLTTTTTPGSSTSVTPTPTATSTSPATPASSASPASPAPAAMPTPSAPSGTSSSTPPSRAGLLRASEAIAATMTLQSTASQASGIPFQYQIGVSCAAVAGSTCDGMTVSIPIPADLNVSGATNPSAWAVNVTGTDTTLIPTTVDLVNGQWVITFLRSMTPGESQAFTFTVTPPAGTTPNNTTWTLSATVTGTNVTPTTTTPTTPATATADATCLISPKTIGSNPVGSTQTYTLGTIYAFGFTGTGISSGYLDNDPSAAAGTVTLNVPTGFTFVSASDGGTYDDTTRLVTWTPWPATGQTIDWFSPTVTLILPSTIGTYSAPEMAQRTPIGSDQATCSGALSIPVTTATLVSGFWTKRPWGVSQYGSQNNVGSGTSTVNYVRAAREGRTVVPSRFLITINRNNATMTNLHLFDGMPCLVQADGVTPQDGTTTTTPYSSLPESSPPCAGPAFDVTSIVNLSGTFTSSF
ncbi:MAG: hypothetical protein FWF28_04295, partial [Micrococcales bacterium]|nr:hypothetical protein [Micrococcales bacterium]